MIIDSTFYIHTAIYILSFIFIFYISQSLDFAKIIRIENRTFFTALALQIIFAVSFAFLFGSFIIVILPF